MVLKKRYAFSRKTFFFSLQRVNILFAALFFDFSTVAGWEVIRAYY
jgi:hypothetical protein